MHGVPDTKCYNGWIQIVTIANDKFKMCHCPKADEKDGGK